MKSWDVGTDFDQPAFDLRKQQIEAMIVDYEDAIRAAQQWSHAWKSLQPKGFRALRQGAR